MWTTTGGDYGRPVTFPDTIDPAVVADLLDKEQRAALDAYRAALARVDEVQGVVGQAEADVEASDIDDRAAALQAARAGEATAPASVRPGRVATLDRARRHAGACETLAHEALDALANQLVPAADDLVRLAWAAVDDLGDRAKPAQVERAASAVLWALGLPEGPQPPPAGAINAFMVPDRAEVEREAHERQQAALDALGQRVATALADEAETVDA